MKAGARKPVFRYQRNLKVSPARLATFCRKHHLVRLGFFGSVVRDDFTRKSDVDVLYEFAEGKTPGIGYMDVIWELERIVGRKVDFVPILFVPEYARDALMGDAEFVYGEDVPASRKAAVAARA